MFMNIFIRSAFDDLMCTKYWQSARIKSVAKISDRCGITLASDHGHTGI